MSEHAPASLDDVPSLPREWRVHVYAVSGSICIEPTDGVNYITKGLFGNPFPHWEPGGGRYTKSKEKAERLMASCQRWCDKRNAKESQARQRADSILAELERR